MALRELTVEQFGDHLASAEPVPGGGSASAVAASLAASLLVMVARLSLDRPKYAAYQETIQRAVTAGEAARVRFLDLADEDAAVYAGFAEAMKLPRDDEAQAAERQSRMQAGARGAAEVPAVILRETTRLVDEIHSLAGRSNLNAASDLRVASLLAEAAGKGAAANVLVNLPMVGDDLFAGQMTAQVQRFLSELEQGVRRVAELVAGGELREPERR